MYGIRGKILRVHLGTGEIEEEEKEEAFYRTYLGGRGIGLYYLLQEQRPNLDPFSPEALLVFAPGFLTGSKAPAAPRVTVCGKSPLTGGYGEGEAGGYFGPELKQAGFDAIVVEGCSPKPVYLWIKDGRVEIRDASHLWGLKTGPAQDSIREELGERRARILQIGPGGENKVYYACIVNELAHFNGRTGLGAVMGSKNLKAIAVRGTKSLEVADPEGIKEIFTWTATEGMKNPLASTLHDLGTPVLMNPFHEMGILPTRNWSRGTFSEAHRISGETMKETILSGRGGCYACPIRCKRVVKVEREDLFVDPRYGGPEYESLASLGSILEVGDLELLAKANELCNTYTLDTISTGMTIAFAIACYEEGLIESEDCDGLHLQYGDGELLITLIEKIAHLQGFGKELAQGSLRLAERIGPSAKKHLFQVKGQEIPMHDPRVKTGVGLSYALAAYGADHMKAPHDGLFAQKDSFSVRSSSPLGLYGPIDPTSLDNEKLSFFKTFSIYWTLLDSLGLCLFGYAPRGPISLEQLLDLIKAVTGTYMSLYELMQSGERGIHMARVFNMREGFSSADDTLPELFFEGFLDGPNKGEGAIDKDDFYHAVKMFYRMMGWDEERGHPREEKLVELNLHWLL